MATALIQFTQGGNTDVARASDGMTAVTVRFDGVGITGSPSVEVYGGATLRGSSILYP